MSILLDMNISPEWVLLSCKAGFDCVHWTSIGAPTAEDREIFTWASANGYVVFTHDLDFGAILAATNAKAPSVIQIRMQNWLPEEAQLQRITEYLNRYAKELDGGALISIDESRLKIRILPLKS